MKATWRLLGFAALALILVASATLAFFIATWDADAYRPMLVSRLERLAGRPITLGRISVGFRGGLALAFEELAVASDSPGQLKPALRVEKGYANLKLLPLARKRLEFSSICLLRPTLRINDGEVSLEEVRLEARVVDGRLQIQNLSARLGEGALTLRGAVWMASPPARGVRGEVEFDLQALPLHRLLPPAQPRAPALRGNLSSPQKIQIQAGEGVDGALHLCGVGSLRIEQGRIENLNVLREVFQRLSVLPGLTGRLLERLPESYRKKFEARDTVLEPMALDLRLEGQRLTLQRIRVATEDFELTGEGRIHLSDRALELPALLRIEPELSAALIRSVEELQVLADLEGRLKLPVRVQGKLPRLAVMPDLESIGAGLLAGQVQDWVGGLLKKALE